MHTSQVCAFIRDLIDSHADTCEESNLPAFVETDVNGEVVTVVSTISARLTGDGTNIELAASSGERFAVHVIRIGCRPERITSH
jgi:hypothetical protein